MPLSTMSDDTLSQGSQSQFSAYTYVRMDKSTIANNDNIIVED